MTTPPNGPGDQPAHHPAEAASAPGAAPPPAASPAPPAAQPPGASPAPPPGQPAAASPYGPPAGAPNAPYGPPAGQQPPPSGAPGGFGAPAPSPAPIPGDPGGGVAVAAPPQTPAGQGSAGAPAVPGGRYVSPIPVEGTNLGHALVSEWTKIRSVRSTVWTLAAMFGSTVGIALLVSMAIAAADEGAPATGPGFFGILLGHIAIITFGVLVMSTEYTSGMIRTTFTASPKRGRVLLAKCVVFSLIAFTMTAAALGLSMVLSDAIMGETFYSREMPGDAWMPAVVGVAAYVTLLGLLGIAVACLLRSSAGAITLMLGVVLVPTIAAPFMYISDALKDVAEALDSFAPIGAMGALTLSWEGDWDYNGWPQTGLLAGVTLVALIGAYARLTSSDA